MTTTELTTRLNSERENYLTRIFGQCETLCCNETLQFEDYNNMAVLNYFDPEERKQRRINVFPEDCRKVSELRGRLVNAARQAATLPL